MPLFARLKSYLRRVKAKLHGHETRGAGNQPAQVATPSADPSQQSQQDTSGSSAHTVRENPPENDTFGGTVGRYQLISNDPILLGTIKNFNAWLGEIDRVLTYHLFNTTDDKPNISFYLVQTMPMQGVAYTTDYQGGKRTVISSDYLKKISVERRWAEISGVLIHEMTHALQNNGGGRMPGYLIEAVADYIRLRGGLASPSWQRDFSNMNAAYSGGAFFLDYIDRRFPSFVKNLNAKSKYTYSDDFYRQITGKTKVELWNDYVRSRGQI